ncbi:MAG: structural cement protein Gp24 [Planctomycetota bacterium]|jgi:hypothetical protein
MSQTSVSNFMSTAVAGLDADTGISDIISRVNSTQQLEQVTIAGSDDGTFTISINGTTEATYEASSASVPTIAAGLLASASSPTANVTFEASGVSAILIEGTANALYSGDDTSYTVTVGSTGTSTDITATQLQAQDQQIPFGVGVVADPRAANSGEQCRLPRLTGEITAGTFLGISRFDSMLEANSGNGYPNQSAVSIKRVGRIYVQVEDAVTEGGQVFCRFTDPSTNYGLGSFRSNADSDAVAVPGALYKTSAAAGGFAIVELNPTR